MGRVPELSPGAGQPVRKAARPAGNDFKGMKAGMKKSAAAIAASLVVLMGFNACETAGRSAMAGAATGAAIGGLATGRGEGALKGAAIGAGVGYLGHKLTEPRRDRVYVDRRYSRHHYHDGYYY